MTEQSQMLFIPKREILEMLKSAFDEGWQGYQDLRDPTAEQILDDWCEEYKERRLKETGMTPVTNVEMAQETQLDFDFNDGVPVVVTPQPTTEVVTPELWHAQQPVTTWGSVTVNTNDGWRSTE